MTRVFIPTSNVGKLREFEHAFALQGKGCLGINAALAECGGAFSWEIPEEDRETFTGNNCQKLFAGLRVLPSLAHCQVNSVVVDDSGLCVPRLNFQPGVHSATYGGLPRDDAKNRRTLIGKLEKDLGLLSSQFEPAFFVCSLLMASEPAEVAASSGNVINEYHLISYLEQLESEIMARVRTRLEASTTMAYGHSINLNFADKTYDLQLVMGFCLGRVAPYEQQFLEGEGHGYDAMFFPNAKPTLSFASIPLHEKNNMSHRSEALRGFSVMAQSRTVQGEILELF